MNINEIMKLIDYSPPERKDFMSHGPVSIITATSKVEFIENIFLNYSQQLYKDKELIIILNARKLDLTKWRHYSKPFSNVSIYQLNEKITLGSCLNYAASKAKGKYIAKFDDDDYYSPYYLSDLINQLAKLKIQIIGKLARFIYFTASKQLAVIKINKSNTFVNHIIGASYVIKRNLFENIKFDNLNVGEDTSFNKKCIRAGYKLFAADPFNYAQIRYPDKRIHTWPIADNKILSREFCHFVTTTDNFKSLITI